MGFLISLLRQRPARKRHMHSPAKSVGPILGSTMPYVPIEDDDFTGLPLYEDLLRMGISWIVHTVSWRLRPLMRTGYETGGPIVFRKIIKKPYGVGHIKIAVTQPIRFFRTSRPPIHM